MNDFVEEAAAQATRVLHVVDRLDHPDVDVRNAIVSALSATPAKFSKKLAELKKIVAALEPAADPYSWNAQLQAFKEEDPTDKMACFWLQRELTSILDNEAIGRFKSVQESERLRMSFFAFLRTDAAHLVKRVLGLMMRRELAAMAARLGPEEYSLSAAVHQEIAKWDAMPPSEALPEVQRRYVARHEAARLAKKDS
jgi:hypothetical protein